MPKINQYEFHSFYCTACGNKVYDLPRQRSHLHGKGHIKDLYCPICKVTTKCIECQNDEDVFNFREGFLNGAYENCMDS